MRKTTKLIMKPFWDLKSLMNLISFAVFTVVAILIMVLKEKYKTRKIFEKYLYYNGNAKELVDYILFY